MAEQVAKLEEEIAGECLAILELLGPVSPVYRALHENDPPDEASLEVIRKSFFATTKPDTVKTYVKEVLKML